MPEAGSETSVKWQNSHLGSALAREFSRRVRTVAFNLHHPYRIVNMFAVNLTARASTNAERDQLMADASVFAEWFASFVDEGAWLVVEKGPDGNHHIHGLIITDLDKADITQIWTKTVTAADAQSAAQKVKHVYGSQDQWDSNRVLQGHIYGWARYCLKLGPTTLTEEQRVAAAVGVLRRPWAKARAAAHRDPNDPRIRRCVQCNAELPNPRRGQKYCSHACRAQASRERVERSPGTTAFAEVWRVLTQGTRPLPTTQIVRAASAPRDRVRAALKYYAKHGAIRRCDGGWTLVAAPRVGQGRQIQGITDPQNSSPIQ